MFYKSLNVKNWILALIVFSFTLNGFSQRLLFQKKWYRKEIYTTGEIISFRIKGDRSKITRQILGFEDDSLIVFQDLKVNPKAISHLYVDKKTRTWYILKYKYQALFPLLGTGFMLLEFVNTGKLSESTLIFGVSLVTAGVLAKLFISNTIKIKGKRKLMIIQ